MKKNPDTNAAGVSMTIRSATGLRVRITAYGDRIEIGDEYRDADEAMQAVEAVLAAFEHIRLDELSITTRIDRSVPDYSTAKYVYVVSATIVRD